MRCQQVIEQIITLLENDKPKSALELAKRYLKEYRRRKSIKKIKVVKKQTCVCGDSYEEIHSKTLQVLIDDNEFIQLLHSILLKYLAFDIEKRKILYNELKKIDQIFTEQILV